jgi:arginase
MIKVIGIPFDANSSFLKGSSLAPDRVRLMEKEGSANAYAENGTEIKKNVNF